MGSLVWQALSVNKRTHETYRYRLRNGVRRCLACASFTPNHLFTGLRRSHDRPNFVFEWKECHRRIEQNGDPHGHNSLRYFRPLLKLQQMTFFETIRLTFHVNAIHMKCQPECLQEIGKKSKCRLLQFCSAQKRLEIAQQSSLKLKQLRWKLIWQICRKHWSDS